MSDNPERIANDTNGERIEELSLEEEMRTAYLTYSMSVIVSRALPDVRDGLKPSQRRILVAMNDLHLGPRAKFRKCAKIVGETMGNYHPHGDGAIYPTLVRMGQGFSSRYCLVDSQGNFGSIDGDPPAAMRYTEARMSSITTQLLEDLDKNTVDFTPNFDNTTSEPTVLPGKIPNLLCNGSSGIAVGMATNIPPHNMKEVAASIIKLIENPDLSTRQIMQTLPGPDFPTGGLICGLSGIYNAYETGRGSLILRARAHTETYKKDRKRIVITEIPYQLNKTRLIEKIADLVKNDQIKGISDIRDESDRDGMRLIVEIKRGEEEEVVLNQLFKFTPLQTTYSMILLALVDRKPRTLPIKEFLQAYIGHRIDVLQRRTRFLLEKAQARAHILAGLRIALAHIDEVIALIKKSPDAAMAKAALQKKFVLSVRQAESILHMRLQTLTGLEMDKIEQEYKGLLKQIEDYTAILDDEQLVLDMIKEDLHEMVEKHGDVRRTEIVEAPEDIQIEDLISEEDVVVTISHEQYIKRQQLGTYRSQGRGGRGIIGAPSKDGDFIEHLFIASTHAYILFFTDKGNVHWLKVYDLPNMGRTARGRAIANILDLRNENITSMIPVKEFRQDQHLFLATERGVVKKTVLSAFGRPQRGGIRAINLDETDRLISVTLTDGSNEVLLGTEQGYAIRFSEEAVRPMGRATRGVGGISLRKKDAVKGMLLVMPDACILTVCEHGYGKRTEFGEYRTTHRNGKGIINIQTTERNGKVVAVKRVNNEDEIMFITAQGMVTRIKVSDISCIGRNTQGVRLVNLKPKDRVVAVARVIGGNGSEQNGQEDEGDTPEAAD